jgi:hypothetical protein
MKWYPRVSPWYNARLRLATWWLHNPELSNTLLMLIRIIEFEAWFLFSRHATQQKAADHVWEVEKGNLFRYRSWPFVTLPQISSIENTWWGGKQVFTIFYCFIVRCFVRSCDLKIYCTISIYSVWPCDCDTFGGFGISVLTSGNLDI